MVQSASLKVLCFTTNEAIVYFLFLLKVTAQCLTFFLVKQRGHFMECSRLQRF